MTHPHPGSARPWAAGGMGHVVTIECPVRAAAQRSPGRLALLFGEQRWTYEQLDCEVGRCAGELVRRGVRRGDRVALRCGNVPQFVFLAHALARLGAILVPLSTRWTKAEIDVVLERIGPRLVIDQFDPEIGSSAHPVEARSPATLTSDAIQAIL